MKSSSIKKQQNTKIENIIKYANEQEKKNSKSYSKFTDLNCKKDSKGYSKIKTKRIGN